jgi:hypothetical protein
MGWWEDFVSGIDEAASKGKIGYTPGVQTYGMVPPRNAAPQYSNAAADAAYAKQQGDIAKLGGAANLRSLVDQQLARQSAPAAPETPSFADFVAMFGGGGGGAPAPDLSGYNSLLADITQREGGFARRKKEQEGYIKGIIEAARKRSEAEKGGIAGRYQTLLDDAATRRAQEVAALQSGEAARIDTRDAARAALGVTGGEDLTSAVTEGAQADIGGTGEIATRDANIQQSIENQQIANQIAGLDPMRMAAFSTLRSNYEDRLAQLAAERAGIKAQMAQIQATPRSGGGRSTSENLALWQAYQGMIGGGEPADVSGTSLEFVDKYAGANNANAPLYRDVLTNFPTLMKSYGQSTTGKLMDPLEVANSIVNANPSYGPAYFFIVDLIKNAQG